MRLLHIVLLAFILLSGFTCSKYIPEQSLEGEWTITSAVGSDNRHWTGYFDLYQKGSACTGMIYWDAVDGLSTGTDSVSGTYNANTKVLKMKSVIISGNIEPVEYTMQVTDHGTKMHGIWTGSSDGSIENPGRWSAVRNW
jgi:hypothetical protein